MSNFPTRAPIGLICGSLLALFAVVPTFALSHAWLPPLQKFYWAQYTVSYLSGTPIGRVAAFFKGTNVHTYNVLAQRGQAVQEPVTAAAGPIVVQTVRMESPAAFHAWLRAHVYHGQDTPDLLKMPAAIWCFSAIALFSLGAFLDFQRRKRSREGEQLRGGELLTVDQFNRVTKGDGFALYVRK